MISMMPGCLVGEVAALLELKRRVLNADREVLSDTTLLSIKQGRDVSVVETLIVQDHMGAESWQAGGYL